jgi:8-oxo-dGTP pyrophosphatase MutT (NUDIX family)
MNKNESEEDASKRELEEELGFVDVIFESGFREVLEYVSSRGVIRKFVLFLSPEQKIKLSRELDKYEWVTTKDLKNFFDYDDIIRIYKSAEKFLKNKILLSSS